MNVLGIGTRVGICLFITLHFSSASGSRPNELPQAPKHAGKFRDPYPEHQPYNLAELTEKQYKDLLLQLKDQHEPGVMGGIALLLAGTGGFGYLGYRQFSKSRCDLSLLSKLRIASPSLLSIVSGIYMLRYTQLSYNQQKLLITNLRNAIAPTPTEQVDSLRNLLREFFQKHPL